jgi:hypothetical protein
MRGILVLLGIIVLAAVVLMSLGMLKINMDNSMPSVSFNVQGGKLPTVSTGSIDIGTTNTTIAVPKVEMGNTTVRLPTLEVKPASSPTPAPAK